MSYFEESLLSVFIVAFAGISFVWITWLYDGGSFQFFQEPQRPRRTTARVRRQKKGVLYLLENYSPEDTEFPTEHRIRSLTAGGLTAVLAGVIVGVVTPLYLSSGSNTLDANLTVILDLTGIFLAFQVGVGLLLIFKIGNWAIAFGFLGSSILVHSLLITKASVSSNGWPALRLLVLSYLLMASWFIARGILLKPGQLYRSTMLRQQSNLEKWVGYTIGALTVVVTLMEFFNIMYNLFVLTR